MEVTGVYMLLPILDDPRYEGFAFVSGTSLRGKTSILRDFLADNGLRNWEAPRLSRIWKPREVTGRVREFNDYPCVNLMIPAFSQRAVDALRDMLEPNGELLPLISDLGSYWAYNVTTVADVLDVDHSDAHWTAGADRTIKRPVLIDNYQFIGEKLEGLSIFRLADDPTQALVTQKFVDRVRTTGMRGFDLRKLWPLPPGVDWRLLHKKEMKRQAKEGLPEGQTVTGNSVIIILKQEFSKASAAERKRIDALMDQLDERLVDRDSDAPAIGSLEGHDYVDGECRLFLSCPDANKLIRKLRPWLETFEWDGEVQIIKRYGEYVDAEAESKFVEIRRTH